MQLKGGNVPSVFGELFKGSVLENEFAHHGTTGIVYQSGNNPSVTITGIWEGEAMALEARATGEKSIFRGNLGIQLSSDEGIPNPKSRDKVRINGEDYVVKDIMEMDTEIGMAWLLCERSESLNIIAEGTRDLT